MGGKDAGAGKGAGMRTVRVGQGVPGIVKRPGSGTGLAVDPDKVDKVNKKTLKPEDMIQTISNKKTGEVKLLKQAEMGSMTSEDLKQLL